MLPTEIIKGCMNNDRKAQFEFYRHFYPALMPVCKRYLNNKEDAESILNLAFLKVFNSIKNIDLQKPIEPWLKKIVINTIIDEFRKKNREKDFIEFKDQFHENDSSNETEKYGYEELLLLLQKLPAVSSKVFNLYVIDGYSHKEIAEMLYISEGTSKWHLSEARNRLKILLKFDVNKIKSA